MNDNTIQKSGRLTGIGALFFTTLIWGGTFTIVKVVLNDISSMLFIGLRFLFASIVILPFAFKKLRNLNKQQILMGSVLGFLLFIGFALQTVGLKYTNASKSGFVTGSVVMFIPLFQFLIEKKKPSAAQLIGSAIVLAGLIFLSVGGTSLSNFFTELGSNFNIGDFLTLLCAISYAVYIIYLDMTSRKIDVLCLVFMQVFVTSILAFIFSSFLSVINFEAIKFKYTQELLFGLLYTSVLATVLTTLLQTKYQKEVSPTNAGIIFSFEPVFAAIIAVIFLGDIISGFSTAGCILIFVGLIISEVVGQKAVPTNE